MVNELQARLHSLYAARMQLAQVGPQMAGLERYRIVASGEQLYTLLEAADRIAELEAAFRTYAAHRPSCPRSAIPPGDKSCTCGLYALFARSAPSDPTAANRGGEPT
jgi:hypothetical protein